MDDTREDVRENDSQLLLQQFQQWDVTSIGMLKNAHLDTDVENISVFFSTELAKLHRIS